MSRRDAMAGVLNIDKPPGLTSHDVVSRVRRLARQRKVGHAGTLDPLATGVLLVCLGQATRLIEYVVAGHKQYRAVIHFGLTTDTYDAEGEIISRGEATGLTAETLRGLLPRFVGQIQQKPPIYSALKKGGRPLYERARAGEAVTVEARPVVIYGLDWVAWEPPRLTLEVSCGPGTYIRSLAHDLGQLAGPGAHLAGLTRTAVGPWTLAEAVSLDTLEASPDWQTHLHPPDAAVKHLPALTLNAAQAQKVQYGQQLELEPPTPTDLLRVYTPAGAFLAILTLADADARLWQPKKVFHP